MKFFRWSVLCLVVLFYIDSQWCNAFPNGCHHCAARTHDGFPREKCCNECPICHHNFDVEAPKDPGCRKTHKYHYDVEKFTECQTESYDKLDANVEILPKPKCRKSYQYHYDVDEPCHCEEASYDTYDFEVMEPNKPKKCSKVKLQAYADHPVRECQCDCHNRRYVDVINNVNRTVENENDRNRIPRLKRSLSDRLNVGHTDNAHEDLDRRPFLYHTPRLGRNHLRRRNPYLRHLQGEPRPKRKDQQDFTSTFGGFVCHCVPSEKSEHSEIVGAPKIPKNIEEPAVYIGDSSNPITYEQIKKHLDALPREEYSPTTNDVIGNLTVLFYDIYQQKHKRNFTVPLKYGTRTVVDKGDGLQTYDIGTIEGEYKPPTLNRLAGKGLNLIGRKIDQKTGQGGTRPEGPRRNRLRRKP